MYTPLFSIFPSTPAPDVHWPPSASLAGDVHAAPPATPATGTETESSGGRCPGSGDAVHAMMATVAAQRRVPTLDPRHRIRTAVLPPVRALRLRAPAGQPTRACDDRQGTPGSGVPRRGLLLAGVAASPLLPMLQARAGAAPREAPVADVPMARLKLPAGALGAGYALVPISVGGVGPIEFMLDSGLTGELVSPHLRMALQLRGSGGAPVAGLGAGGATSPGELVTLEGAEIGGLPLPPLPAIVAPFPQEHLDPGHDPVEGMLGMEFLSLFDADLDFPAGRLRLWRPGAARAVADRAGLAEVCAPLPESAPATHQPQRAAQPCKSMGHVQAPAPEWL